AVWLPDGAQKAGGRVHTVQKHSARGLAHSKTLARERGRLGRSQAAATFHCLRAIESLTLNPNQSILRMNILNKLAAVLLTLELLSTAAVRAGDWVVYQGKKGPGQGRHIVFLSGDEEYRSEEGLPQLARILAVHHGFKCTVLFSIKDGEID